MSELARPACTVTQTQLLQLLRSQTWPQAQHSPVLIVAPLNADPPHLLPWCVCRTPSRFPPSVPVHKQTSLRRFSLPTLGLSAALCFPPRYWRSLICSGACCSPSLTLSASTDNIVLSERSSSEPCLNQWHPELSWTCWPVLWGTRSQSDDYKNDQDLGEFVRVLCEVILSFKAHLRMLSMLSRCLFTDLFGEVISGLHTKRNMIVTNNEQHLWSTDSPWQFSLSL